jgi:hypothetical protein
LTTTITVCFNACVRSFLACLVEAAYPDAQRDPAAAAAEPFRSLRLIGLIRTLVDYGHQLIRTARRCAGTPDFLAFARPIGTTCDSAWKKDPLGGVIGAQKGPL